MRHFSYKGGCGTTHVEAFKRKLALATYKQLWVIRVISNIMLFKTVYASKELINRAILSYQNT